SITRDELDTQDPYFPATICVRAVKPCAKKSPPIPTAPSVWNAGAILFYHRVADLASDAYGLCVSPDEFRSQMEHLREKYNPISLQDFAALSAKGELPPKAVAVTFDDGYLDNLTTVSPILREFDIPATFFVPTEKLDTEHESWWDVLERIFLTGGDLPEVFDVYGNQEWFLRTGAEEQRSVAHKTLMETFYPMTSKKREKLIRRLSDWSGMDLTPRQTHRHMIVEELKQLASMPGHTIGCHTIHHLSLPDHSIETQTNEIMESRQCLEQVLGRPVSIFSYPYGEHDKTTLDILRNASFELGVTVEGRTVCCGAEQLLLPRFEVRSGEGFTAFMRRIFSQATIKGVA
ncbi:MAG: polysaccharide deacetylase family protein, partial [Candidatus Electrothrix sp.]